MSNIFSKKTALIDSINTIRESVSKEYADEHKAKAMAARNSGKMSDYHKHMATHHDHLATHFSDKGDSRAADLHMNKATEHENKAKEVSEAKLDSVKSHELKKDFKDRQDKDIDNDGKVDSSDEYLHKRRQAISQKMKSEGFSDKEIDALLEYEMSRRADGKYVDDEGNVMSKPPSRWASKKVASDMYRPGMRSSYRRSYDKPKNEEVEIEEEQIDELSKKTLGSYAKKAMDQATSASSLAGQYRHSRGTYVFSKEPQDDSRKNFAAAASDVASKRSKGVKKAIDRLAKEEVEIEDVQESGMVPRFKRTEISKSKYEKLRDQMHSKPKKPTFHMEIKDGHNVSQFSDESGAVEHWHHLKTGKVTYKRVSEELDYDIQEQSDREEKHEMAQTQAHFIKYAAEEILEYIDMGGEIEEWYQNKLAKVHSDMESLHSYMEGEKRRLGMAEEVQEASLRKSIAQISGSFPERSSVKTKDGKSGTVLTVGKDFVKVAHGNKMKDYKPSELTKESTEEVELDERNKENAMRRKMMDASRGARYKVSGNPVPEREPEHKTGQAHNKAIGRALRNEEAELEEASEISPKQNMLLRAMATDPKDINKMRRAIKLGDKALMNPVMRQEILRMLDQMMDVSLNDPTIFAKTRQIFKKRKATDTTNTE